jgi:hypothetical protein
MKKTYTVALLSLSTLGSGCASIVTGHNQSVSVETRAKQGQAVLGANCKLSNDKGTWFVTSPGSVSVRRSYDDMIVNCEKDGQEPGIANVKSSTKAMAFGNIIFGGIIGAGVDVASGAAYDYPTLFTVTMGEKSTVDAPPVDKPADTAPKQDAASPQAATPTPPAATAVATTADTSAKAAVETH